MLLSLCEGTCLTSLTNFVRKSAYLIIRSMGHRSTFFVRYMWAKMTLGFMSTAVECLSVGTFRHQAADSASHHWCVVAQAQFQLFTPQLRSSYITLRPASAHKYLTSVYYSEARFGPTVKLLWSLVQALGCNVSRALLIHPWTKEMKSNFVSVTSELFQWFFTRWNFCTSELSYWSFLTSEPFLTGFPEIHFQLRSLCQCKYCSSERYSKLFGIISRARPDWNCTTS
jgi:hypothetical protein